MKGNIMITLQDKLIQFWLKSCVPRCFSFLSVKPISDDAYVTTYEHCLQSGDSYGELTGSGYVEVLIALDLQEVGNSDSYQDTEKHFAAGLKIMIRSEVDLWPREATNIVKHASVLTAINESHFSVFSPQQDGSWRTITLESKYWTVKICRSLLYKEFTGGVPVAAHM